MIDISSLNPLFIQIPVLVILLLGLVLGFKDGIIRKLLDFGLFALLIFLMVFIVPPLAKQLESTGVIQEFVAKNFSGDIANLIAGLLTGPTYYVLVGLMVLVVYAIVKLIINIFIRMLFKHKGMVNRILGAIWQTTIHLVFVGVLLVIIASPSIFKGGEELIMKSAGLKEIYGGVNKVQEVLEKNDLPYDVESLAAKALAGKDATPEDLARYQSTLSRVGDLLESSKNGTIVNEVIDPTTGEINQDKASQLIDDVIVLSELMSKLPESSRDKLAEPINNVLVDARDNFIDKDGNAKETITVTQEQSDSLNEVLKNIGIDENLVNDINKCIVVK